MLSSFSAVDLDMVRARMADESIAFTFQPVTKASLVMSVIRGLDVSYARALDASYRAMLLLEDGLGPIRTIEEVPRDKWKLSFAVIEAVGALEKDDTPLMRASKNGDLLLVTKLLDATPDRGIDETSPMGITALMYAAGCGHAEIVNFLLSRGADVNAHGSECTPLQVARGGGPEMVRLLLDSGANANEQNRYGETALLYAARLAEREIVEVLVQGGADPNIPNNHGVTPLAAATKNNHKSVVELLSKLGAL